MLTSEQSKNIVSVSKHFQRLDNQSIWTDADESISTLEWLSEKELMNESYILAEKHRWGNPRCTVEHSKEACIIPLLVKAVNAILEHYDDNKEMHPDHKLVLQWYLALDHTGELIY